MSVFNQLKYTLSSTITLMFVVPLSNFLFSLFFSLSLYSSHDMHPADLRCHVWTTSHFKARYFCRIDCTIMNLVMPLFGIKRTFHQLTTRRRHQYFLSTLSRLLLRTVHACLHQSLLVLPIVSLPIKHCTTVFSYAFSLASYTINPSTSPHLSLPSFGLSAQKCFNTELHTSILNGCKARPLT